ncbi:DUF4180 domain-containing protein [Methylocella sp. CPCC 101449]|jgi:hypothetical protein|uniref:DUF4180 domain-containing protein n=1 Tax=Methylocella sp. CPCC 101449 TaxID=2987531 RepID=UPI00288E8D4A|nr:DUF4180 domain-containing protein [Methylocella sp. CPCC 101449]MDT2023738.1 DUF4180 domain-containing protein [Methylocella sp. CPCC 101449]HEV2573724.1 DUF4180 domain-containing protein [Beijerinckiaceae bacterium]
MNGHLDDIAGQRVFLCDEQGPDLSVDRHLSDLIGDLYGSEAGLVAIPLPRLGPDFLRLSSGIAGHILQKLTNYQLRVAILGDISKASASSLPLRDFIRETNQGKTIWFVPDLPALIARLTDKAAR